MITHFTEQLYDLSDTIIEVTITSIESQFHWIRITMSYGSTVVEQGFASTLLGAVFESEI